jgi:hypothetical protein
MGYCDNPWISDYTYEAVLDFRAAAGATAARATEREQPSLLVWGRIVGGRAVLEPAFQVVTRPTLPTRPGPYSIEATTSDGATAFRLSFDAVPVADDPRGARHFAFAVPIDQATASGLRSIRLAGPAAGPAEVSRSMASLRAGPVAAPSASVTGRGVAVRWEAGTHPMALVRDAATGEVLSFGRGGEVVVNPRGAELDLTLSDGVQSRSARIRAGGP